VSTVWAVDTRRFALSSVSASMDRIFSF
jgi:hypothetical protein